MSKFILNAKPQLLTVTHLNVHSLTDDFIILQLLFYLFIYYHVHCAVSGLLITWLLPSHCETSWSLVYLFIAMAEWSVDWLECSTVFLTWNNSAVDDRSEHLVLVVVMLLKPIDLLLLFFSRK